MQNPEVFAARIAALRAAGAEQLHILSDFDKTLTRCVQPDGRKSMSSIALIREHGYLGEEYVRASYALFDQYHPFETDPDIPHELLLEKMDAWWEEHLSLLIRSGMRRSIVEDIVRRDLVPFRPGLRELFALTAARGVPFLVFSAGSGDIIRGALSRAGLLLPHVHIIANFFSYGPDGMVTGYQGNIVHSFNKSEVQLRGSPYADVVSGRRKVVVLGDSLGDLGMSAGLEHDVVLSLGFLNGREALRDRFLAAFDAVILEDAGLADVLAVLSRVLD